MDAEVGNTAVQCEFKFLLLRCEANYYLENGIHLHSVQFKTAEGIKK